MLKTVKVLDDFLKIIVAKCDGLLLEAAPISSFLIYTKIFHNEHPNWALKDQQEFSKQMRKAIESLLAKISNTWQGLHQVQLSSSTRSCR